MAVIPETGFLLVADLTGYTAYLSGAEIEHAPTIAGDLLETIVGRLEPPYRLAKLEGDAAFFFVEDGRAEPGLLLDAIEASYLAFRRRLRSIEQATACDCTACRTAPRLDLKFFLHHGQYVRSRIAGRDELAGSSVIAVHRLLKGEAAARAHDADGRASGFVVYTDRAVGAIGLDPDVPGLTAGREVIEHLGEIVTYVQDLEARWQGEAATPRLSLEDADLLLDTTVTVGADASTVWNHLTSPSLRARWEGSIVLDQDPGSGRIGVGTTLQCVTGRLASIEEIVDWQPFEHAGYRVVVPEVGLILATYDLEAVPSGTLVRHRWSAGGPIDRAGAMAGAGARRAALDRLVDALGPSAAAPTTVSA
jgi:uncharacterized protein DUF2652/polyketide cyclase/dehydrase/lipid transport protein